MGSSGGCGNCADKHPILGRIPVIGKMFRNSTGSSGKRISEQESYDPAIAELEETNRVQRELTQFRVKSEKESDSLEKGALKEARNSIDDMIDFLKGINKRTYAGQKLNLDLDRLRRENRQTEDIINGYIKKRIQKRVSLDDPRCLEILKMQKGAAKERAMTNFLNSVLKESVEGLATEIKKSMSRQLENIEDQINVRIDNYNMLSQEKLEALSEIERIKNTDEHDLESKIARFKFKQSLSVLGLQLLSAEE